MADLAANKMIQGGLVAYAAPGLPFLLHPGMEVALVPPRHDVRRRAVVTDVRQDAKGRCLVSFEGVDTPQAAQRIAGMSLLARRADLPDLKPWQEEGGLIGWEVLDAQAGPVGRVEEVLESPGQLLLSVARPGGGEPALIPLVDAFIVGFDEGCRRVELSLPEGLLAL